MAKNPILEQLDAAKKLRKNALETQEKPGAFGVVKAPKKNAVTWKTTLREFVGQDGKILWQGILRIAAGEAWVPRLPDGREGPPQVPDAGVRLQAFIYLANALYGKPTTQEKIADAEKAAAENMDLKALSDEQLEELARKHLLKVTLSNESDAEIVPEEPDGK